MYCSCKYRTGYGIGCPHVYLVISQSKEFEEPSHHDISVCWWNTFYQISCLSLDNKEFEAYENTMKVLQLNEKDGLPVKKWFNHLPIRNKKYISDVFKNENYPYCMNHPLIKVEDKKLQRSECNPFASSFTQKVSTYADNCYKNDTIFDNYFAMDDINENVGLTYEIKPYSTLIDVLKEMTNHLEGHCTVNNINKIREYLNNKIVKAKKREAHNLNLSNIEGIGEFISVTLPL